MSFEMAFLLVFVFIPVGLCLFFKFWDWVTKERFWAHRKTARDYWKEWY